MTDGKTIYMKIVPKDPDAKQNYYYRIIPGSSNKKYQLFARLANTQDKDCLGGDCENSPVSYSCGSEVCNYAVTSANTSFSE